MLFVLKSTIPAIKINDKADAKRMLCRPPPLPRLQPLLLQQQHMTLRLDLQVRCLVLSWRACDTDQRNTLCQLTAGSLRYLGISFANADKQKMGSMPIPVHNCGLFVDRLCRCNSNTLK